MYKILVGKPDGKRPFGRNRRMWEGNIKMGLKSSARTAMGTRPKNWGSIVRRNR
jgi:hypothetical protein